MTPDEVRQSITGWCSPDGEVEYVGERSEPGTDFALALRAGAGGAAGIELLALQSQGSDHVTLRLASSLASASADDAQRILDTRPGTVSGSVDRGYSGATVTAQTDVYHDGLSKNSFLQAAAELARTGKLLGTLATTAAATPVSQPQPQPAIPQAQTMAAPTFSAQPQPQSQPQAAPLPQPVPAQASWAPTHSVPPQGMRAWAAPDPAGPVVANLAPGLPIQVSEVRGAWARVICSNGWTGWVDGRIIGVAA